MKIFRFFPLSLLIATAIDMVGSAIADDNVEWSGDGKYRLLVRIDASEASQRPTDERPAELQVDFQAELEKLGIEALPDIASIQVMQYDPQTGQPQTYANYAYARSANDRPFRWYDASIPYEFPDFHDALTRTKDQIVRRNRTRAGYFYNALGDWRAGRLAWVHTQTDDADTHYAVYFNLLPSGAKPESVPPRGWLGDGLPRCDQVGTSSTGADHSRLELDDWNGDGLVDLIVGESYGHLLWWPNSGTKEQPEFRYSKFVTNADGVPLDAGMSAAPKVVDWNGDGVKDLLVGANWNRILYYQNTGTDRDRKLVYRGPVRVGELPLELPLKPLTRGEPEIFKRDYYPVLETVDWDGDGDPDLLAGGYITGLIFFYENTGRSAGRTPELVLRGPIEADGKLLNVGHWCAAPCAADFDGDGDLDLMSGNYPMYVQPSEASLHENDFLQYFENVGTRQQPLFESRAFPGEGSWPRSRLATPRAADFDADGDLDLVVSSSQDIFMFSNEGSTTNPKFITHSKHLPSPWGLASIGADQFRDWDGDGRLDMIRDYTVRLNSGAGNPFRWTQVVSVLPPGQHIEHPSGIGDDWFWPRLDDFDQDGKIDVMFGDWHGHVWLHRNLSTADQQEFDLKGVRLKLTSGVPIKVGPPEQDPANNFSALQGARTVFTVADFDRDGERDLVVGDTYGKVRYFRNATPHKATEPSFADPTEFGNLGIRGLVDSADWNSDGWPDVIASAANGKVRVFLNQGDGAEQRFAAGFDPGLPPIIQPRVIVADINGDGDEDLFLPSTQGSCFVERSFLKSGYARAVLTAIQQRPNK
ncbi:MAG: VCBS repeat-containing protein [Planctomycetaceae bacterium]